VYNSNPQVAPFKKDVVPKKSEYNAQFKGWKPSVPEDSVTKKSRTKGTSKVKWRVRDIQIYPELSNEIILLAK